MYSIMSGTYRVGVKVYAFDEKSEAILAAFYALGFKKVGWI